MFKSPLAYTSSFYFIGRKGGIERKWMLYESDDESNKIDLLYESPTEERNGVKIIVPVKYSDSLEFYRKIKEQLAYFENVYFDCGTSIKNEEVKIIRSEHFQWSSLSSDSEMHICLDNVYYPISFDKLGISDILFPIGLKFSLTDGLFPVPNREQLKYTKEAKELIIKKIGLVADYFINKYNESIKDSDDVFAILEYYQNSSRNVPHLSGNGWMDVQYLKYHSKIAFIAPKLNNVKLLDIERIYETREYLLNEYSTKYSYSNGRFNTEKNNNWRQRVSLDNTKQGQVYLFSDLSGAKKTYLREILGYSRRYFVRKDKPFKLGNIKSKYTGRGYEDYVGILRLHDHPRSEWRERIKEWQYIVSLIASRFVDVDKIDIPQEWIDGRKKERVQKMVNNGTNVRRKKLTGEVTGKECQNLERYVSGKNCKLVSTMFQMKDAHKDKKFTIYGGMESETLFQKLYTILVKKSVRLVILSERELKNLKEIELHNWMEIGKFMEGKHKIFRRIVTAYLINKLKKDYSSVFSRIWKLKEISTKLGNDVEKLNKYEETYYLNGDTEIYESMIKVAEEYKLFDTSIYNIYKEVEFILLRLPFISPIFSSMSTYLDNKGIIKATRDLFKYYKQRIDWQHYTLPINEEMTKEEAVELLELEENILTD